MTDAGDILAYTATGGKLIEILKTLVIDPLFKFKKYHQNDPITTLDFMIEK